MRFSQYLIERQSLADFAKGQFSTVQTDEKGIVSTRDAQRLLRMAKEQDRDIKFKKVIGSRGIYTVNLNKKIIKFDMSPIGFPGKVWITEVNSRGRFKKSLNIQDTERLINAG